MFHPAAPFQFYLLNQVKRHRADFLSPVDGQFEVRDADVVLSTVQLNVGLRRKENQRKCGEGDGYDGLKAERYPGNREKPLEEVDVYRSPYARFTI